MFRENCFLFIPSLLFFFLCVTAVFIFIPRPASAESLVLYRIIDEIESIDLSSIKDVKLGATLKTDKKGDLVVRCFDLFTIPLAERPFENSPKLQALAERTSLKVDQKGKGVYINIAFAF